MVPIVGSPPFAGSRSLSVVLSDPSSTAQIATPASAVVMISGNTLPAPGSLQLSDVSYAVAQTSGQLIVTVNRVSGSQGAASVSYSTTGGTAVAGVDFTSLNGTLEWADGDAASKTFTIAVSGANPFAGSKSLTVLLSDPVGASAWAAGAGAALESSVDCSRILSLRSSRRNPGDW